MRSYESFSWAQEWADQPDSKLTMAHSSIALPTSGDVITGATDQVALVFRDRQGGVLRVVPVPDADDLHGLTLAQEEGTETLWVADTSTKLFGGSADLEISRVAPKGQVLQIDLDGKTRRRLDDPPHPAYGDGGSRYSPTAVAVDEGSSGGGGDIYVADGYGASLVHRYAKDGTYLDSISGEQGAGHFKEPHDVLIDRRGEEPRLLVADRVNHRIQAFALDGTFDRVICEGELPGPTQLAIAGDTLVVTDLLAGRVSLIDSSDRLIGHLFAHPSPPPAWDDLPDGWPNARRSDGQIGPAELVPEVFHTPHGLAADVDGTLYVSEFAIGGRIAVLGPS